MINFRKYKHAEPTAHPNFLLIPVIRFGFNDEDIEQFNNIYQFLLNSNYKKFIRTPSGGICTNKNQLSGNRWDLKLTTTLIELTVGNVFGYFRFQIGYTKKDMKVVPGRRCWNAFKNICNSFNIDITKFALPTSEEGWQVKQSIPKQQIKILNERDLGKTFDNCHHLDLNSSFMSGIAHYTPELKEPIDYIYRMRKSKNNALYKAILTHTFGFMQCKFVEYRYSHLSKQALIYNNDYIYSLLEKLNNTGRRPIAVNTDGIWYQGELYQDENYGYNLGQWKNDHINCTLRYKSDGCYEFIENGKYTPVLRGQSTYEKIVPRDLWKWGDIYKGHILAYYFDEEIGLVKEQ